ncbi:hypothetical protein BA20089_06280 [Bifidobacterium asteroides DSM 20089]|uniref:Uncharacterized protein n=1 Tax=Bifidobacterium asteroides DSM 20089 TaxID=1437594 RepID=A0AAD0AAB1_9BIFI|nr:hypothetical protein BA20089_06280 [Bifidobacterium asteroides DSM 20089]
MRRQLAQDPPIIPIKTILRTDTVLGILLGAINIEPFCAWTNNPPMATPMRGCRLTSLVSPI